MACDSIKVRVPGSVMLFGEHAVLAGYPAIVTAIEQYVTLIMTVREDDRIVIHSDQFSHYETRIADLSLQAPYQFVLACLLQQKERMKHGLTITIQSTIDPTLGLGSSAAVTVAMLLALKELGMMQSDIWQSACQVIRQVQKRGSGMDALASLYGGVLYYDPAVTIPKKLTRRDDLRLVYSGYKTPTAEVLQKVVDYFEDMPLLLERLYSTMGETVRMAYSAWMQEDKFLLAKAMNIYQGLQQALQVSDAHCDQFCLWLRERVRVEGVKISGSGLGDCLLTLGSDWREITEEEIKRMHPRAQYFPVQISEQGASVEGVMSSEDAYV
jgi:mevalonate kinase